MEGKYTFVVVSTSEEEFIDKLMSNEEEKDSDYILDMSDRTMTKEEVEALLGRKDGEEKVGGIRWAREHSKSGVSTKVYVKFNSETVKNIGIGRHYMDIYKDYGIIPIVPAEVAILMVGKKEIYGYTEKQMDFLKGNDILGFVVNNEMLEKTRDIRDGIRGLLDGLKEIVEDSPAMKYKKGMNAAQSSKFDYKVIDMEKISALKYILSLDGISAGNIVKSGHSDEIFEEATEIKNVLELFSVDAQNYIDYLKSKGEYAQILGFIRGVVLRSVVQEIVDKEIISIDNEGFLADQKSNMVQTILIMTVQQLVNKEENESVDEVLKDLFALKGGSDEMTAKDYLEQIQSVLNVKMEEVLRKNETKIDTSKAALSDFDGIPELLMDRYGRKVAVQQLNISLNTVKSMLAAA